MNFLENIFARLEQAKTRPVLREVRGSEFVTATGEDVLTMVRAARGFLRAAGLKPGDRCALLAANSIRWTALDLALMAEGLVVVPLYARQAPAELVGMMKDCAPALICCGDAALRDAVLAQWPEAPRAVLFDEVFAAVGGADQHPLPLGDSDAVAIIYTSGTSGEPKGVVLTVGNLNHMLPCTIGRLDQLMGTSTVLEWCKTMELADAFGIAKQASEMAQREFRPEPDQVFHYLPFNFAGSWVLMLTCLSRDAVLTMSTDLTKLVDELKLAAPDYFLNVPALLERVKSGIEEQLQKKGGFALKMFRNGRAAWLRRREGKPQGLDALWLALASTLVFSTIRKKIGPNLKALICGSAPLAEDTQLFFMMLGIPVLQVYGLTETTAICTMDDPRPGRVVPGRVGPAIPGIEMKLAENDEVIVRGPNIFPGYWNRPQQTAQVMRDGWFYTGDQGEVDENGNWRIIGRVKNLLILSSGHNVAPEPIEEQLARAAGAQQVVLIGHARSYVAALVTGSVARDQVQSAIDTVNEQLPHYKRVRAFHICAEPFTIENGLLTANGKLKRDAIAARWRAEIEAMYQSKTA